LVSCADQTHPKPLSVKLLCESRGGEPPGSGQKGAKAPLEDPEGLARCLKAAQAQRIVGSPQWKTGEVSLKNNHLSVRRK